MDPLKATPIEVVLMMGIKNEAEASPESFIYIAEILEGL